jgi:hypothetical protein
MGDIISVLTKNLKLGLVTGIVAAAAGAYLYFALDSYGSQLGLLVCGIGIGVAFMSGDMLRCAPKSLRD